jgi:hypothetical protein
MGGVFALEYIVRQDTRIGEGGGLWYRKRRWRSKKPA